MLFVLEAVAFLLELAALAGYAIWGYYVEGVVLAIALPVLVAVIWSTALSPRARLRLGVWPTFGARVAVLLLSAVALAAAGHRAYALALGLAVLADNALLAVFGRPVAGAR